MDACSSGNLPAVKALLLAGADPSAVAYDEKTTALTEAMQVGDSGVVGAIDAALMKDDVSILEGDLDAFIERVRSGATPVNFEARCCAADMDVKVDKRMRSSSTFFKGMLGRSTVEEEEEEGPQDPPQTDEAELTITALCKACEMSNADWVKTLIELGADVNKRSGGSKVKNDTPLLAVLRTGCVQSLKMLLQHGEDHVNTNVLGSDR